MEPNKKDVIRLLEKIAIYLEIKGENAFRISAYRRAAQALERDERSLEEIDDFQKIKGIGAGTNAIIVDYLENGKSELLEELQAEIPETLLDLLNLTGLGGKRIATLYQQLNIVDIPSLKEKCESGEVAQLPGFGKKTVENILNAIEQFGKSPERFPIAFVLPIVEKIEKNLSKFNEIERFSVAGSVRRLKETVGDLDFIIATNNPQAVREQLLTFEHEEVIASGDTKVSLVLKEEYPINVDFRLVTDEQFATTLHHFTGSKDHNVSMRQIAKKRGEKINEYGVEVEETGEILTFKDEEAFFNHFNLHFIPPELREDHGEIDAFKEKVKLIQEKDIRGDLHMHTTWSDGAQSIEEMVLEARKYGYEYMAITDHSKYLQVAHGLDEERLLRQREEIALLNEKYDDIHIFSGVEMDILPDGSLDFSDDFLKEMDFVIGAIHSSFNQSEEQIMKRLFNALENPYISIIAHPTGRLIGRRDGYNVNMEKLLLKAKETNTALEINANPNRFDLSSEWAKEAQALGVLLSINSDAHNYESLNFVKLGIGVAKKGWIKKETVINTWPLEKLKAYFNRNK